MLKIVEYKPEYGTIDFPQGFADKLAGKTIEEQKAFFRVYEKTEFREREYGELISAWSAEQTYEIDKCSDCIGLVVKDGLLVGVLFKFKACLPGQTVCVYSGSDDDGPGSSSRDDYATLICVDSE